MKFIALLALFGGVSAVRLESHSAIQAHSQTAVPALAHSWAALQTKSNQASLRKSATKFVQTTLKSKLPKDLTHEQTLEIIEWVISELGEGTITKQEAHDALSAFLDKHGFPQPTPEEWEFLEMIFDHMDKNGDGEIDLHEFVFAFAKECGGGEMVQLKKNAKKFVQTKLRSKLPAELTDEQEAEIMDWVIAELGGGTITKQEAHDALVAFLDKHGFPQPTPEEWEFLEAMFDHADANGDGEIDLAEFADALAH